MGQQWSMYARIHGHIWEQQWGSNGACMRAYMAIYGGSNGACIGAYMAIYGGSNGACMRAYMAIYGGSNGACARVYMGHIWGSPMESREGIPCYSLLFPAPGKGITEPSFPSLPFPGSLP